MVVFPNPTSDLLTLNSFTNANYSILTINGKVILSGRLIGHKIDLKNLSAGSYFLKVQDAADYYVAKIIKN